MATSQPRRKKKCYQNSVSRIFGICDERDLEHKTENIGHESFIKKKKNTEKFSQQFFCPFSSCRPKNKFNLFLKSLTRERTVNTPV